MAIDFASRYTPHPRQLVFHNKATDLSLRYHGIGGAMNGGKSRGGCGEMNQRCIDYPGNRVGIFRKNRTTLKRTTLVSWFTITPPDLIASFNKTDLIATLVNGSVILFGEADVTKDPELEKLGSLEMSSFFLDEGTEVPEAVFRRLVTRIQMGRWVLPDGTLPLGVGVVSFNPFPGWCEKRFVLERPADHSFTQFLMKDNPYVTSESIEDLRGILSPAEIQRFIEGIFVHADDPNQLIPYEWCRNAIIPAITDDLTELLFGAGKQSLGVDVARYGDDNSVIIRSFEGRVAAIEVFEDISTFQLAQAVAARINDFSIDTDRVVVDTVGIGAGVYDDLEGLGYIVKEFVGGAKPTMTFGTALHKYRFKDLRSQGYWYLRELLRTGEFGIPDDRQLIEDITAHRYTILGDLTIAVESKDALKKRIGRSPDKSDALVYSIMSDFVRGTSGGEVEIL